MKKIYDLVVANGTYTGSDGEEKTRWLRIGGLMDKGDKKVVAVLEPHINLAALRDEKTGAVWAQCFTPQSRQQAAPATSDNDSPPF